MILLCYIEGYVIPKCAYSENWIMQGDDSMTWGFPYGVYRGYSGVSFILIGQGTFSTVYYLYTFTTW